MITTAAATLPPPSLTSTNISSSATARLSEHLDVFSIDYYKEQPYDEIKLTTMTSNEHDQLLQSTTIKEEETECHVGSPLLLAPSNRLNSLGQPLCIVLDNEDDDDNQAASDNPKKPVNSLATPIACDEQQRKRISSKKPSGSVKRSSSKSKSNPISSVDSSRPIGRKKNSLSKKLTQTVLIDTSFMRQTSRPENRTKLVARRKHPNISSSSSSRVQMSTKTLPADEQHTQGLSTTDSMLSRISFDNTSDILTISRSGSIYYCLEDLYSRVFSSLCTFDEFTDCVVKPENITVKQVTLSEKIAIEQQNPPVKKFHDLRYRLLPINSSDYFLKLKQSLLASPTPDENEEQQAQREKRIDQIIDEMRSYKRTPTPVLLKDKVSHSPMATKRLSSDDDEEDEDDYEEEEEDETHRPECRKRLKIVTKKQKSSETPSLAPTQFGIFIQCNGPVSCNIFSTNESLSSSTTTTTTTTTTTNTAGGDSPSANPPKAEADVATKPAPIKKSTENETYSRSYYPKPNSINEQSNGKSTGNNRMDSQSARECLFANQTCSIAPPAVNMPIKRRILNSYHRDSSDSPSAAFHNGSLSPRVPSRCLYRSKSLTFNSQKRLHRSFSLPATRVSRKETGTTHKSLSTERSAKVYVKSKAEPIDLTDESFAMPMIVNVEENVEPAHQRHHLKSKSTASPIGTPPKKHPPVNCSDLESRLSSTTVFRPTPHDSNVAQTAKSTPLQHPPPSSFYRASPYGAYPQEGYHYRDPSQTVPPPSSPSMPYQYSHSAANMMNPNIYPHPFAGYPPMKKSKDSAMATAYDPRGHPMPSHHPPSTPTPNNNHHHLPASVVMPIVRKPNYYHTLTPEQQAAIKMQPSSPAPTPCRMACCFPSSMMHHQQQQQQQQHPTHDKSFGNERMIYRQYAAPTPAPTPTVKRDPSQTPDPVNGSPSVNRKQRRVESVPPPPAGYPAYPPGKSYFVPPPPPPSSASSSPWPSAVPTMTPATMKPSVRYPYPPSSANPPANGPTRKAETYPQPRRLTPNQSRAPSTAAAPFVPQTSSTLISPPNTPHELTLPNVRTRSIDLQRAIAERGYCDVDKIPKLVVRHTKTYAHKTVDTMGQLFPTWFNEPDYRCIHCFRCDQVFTPQQFMTHVDDEQMQHEQPVNMTSIQLLTSEKMSEYKVGLWNQFCTNLTVYASISAPMISNVSKQ